MRSEIISSSEPCPAAFNLARHVLAHAGRLESKDALQILGAHGADCWSYGRLESAVRGVATGLLSQGLRPGDRLLLRLGNGVDFPLAFLGAVAAGVIPVPTAAGLTAPEVERLIPLIAPRLIIASEDVALPADPPCPVLSEKALRGFEVLPPAGWQMGNPERLAYIVFTSGTSGRPRAVAHAHRAVWARRMMGPGWTGITETDRALHAGALNWTYTLGTGLLDPWAAGATALVTDGKVDPAQIALLLKRFDVTIFAAVPGIYRRILSERTRLDLPHLRHGLSAGEKLPLSTRQAWRAATGTDLHEALGMSECSTFISSSPERPAPDGATGYAQNGRSVAVLGPDGIPVPRGQAGTLAVRRDDPGLFLGTVEGDTIHKITGDWFQTGDMVIMAEDGAITSLGRGDDMINAGGFRVSPAEIEMALGVCPGVAQCAAVELSVRKDASTIAFFYTGDAGEETLRKYAEGCLARYKQPRLYLRREGLPATANGKINRQALRKEWKESQ